MPTDSENSLIWYQEWHSKLVPLRFHLDEVLTEMESYNRWAVSISKATGKPPILLREDKILAARKALDATNK